MTLILSLMSREWIVHVADVRISYGASGIPAVDRARKILFYEDGTASLSLSFTGIAEIQEDGQPRKPTEVWLGDVVPLIAHDSELSKFIHDLTSRLDSAVKATRRNTGASASESRLTVVLVGFGGESSPPGAIVVSNFQTTVHRLPLRRDGPDTLQPVALTPGLSEGEFTQFVVVLSGRYGLLVWGDLNALSPTIVRELRSNVLDILETSSDPLLVRDRLVVAVKHVGKADPRGTVSSDCWSRITWRTSEPSLFESHFDDPTKQSLNPAVVGPGHRVDSVLVSLAPAAAVDNYTSALVAGKKGIDLNEAALRAFTAWSPRLQRFVEVSEAAGMEVITSGNVLNLLRMVRHAGLLYTSSLEQHIAQAGTWADDMLRARVHAAPPPIAGWNRNWEREFLLELLLVAISPDRFPSVAPPGAFMWRVDDELKSFVKTFNPAFNQL
jgi:hypothetical protein